MKALSTLLANEMFVDDRINWLLAGNIKVTEGSYSPVTMKNIKQIGLASTIAFLALNGNKAWGQNESVSLHMADKLEAAIYLQEAKADLDAAILAYETILGESALLNSLAAEAKYRLATCYMDQGKRELAFKTLARIVEEHPEETLWVEAAKKALPKDFAPEITPWFNGERCHYKWTGPAGQVVGFSYTQIEAFEWEGRKLWRAETRALMNGERATVVEFDPDTFETVYGRVLTPEIGAINCWYADDGLSAEVEYEKTGLNKSFNFSNPVYDNEQAVIFMRQLPVEVGYSMETNVFVSIAGVHVGVRFNVSELVEIESILGPVECYRVDLELPGAKQSFYYTADERRILIRLVLGGVESNLEKYDVLEEGKIETYQDDEYSFLLDHRNEWVAIKVPSRPRTKETRLHFVDPEMKGGYSLYADANSKIEDSSALENVDAFADFIIEEEGDRREGEYEFEKFLGAAHEINGLPVKGFKLHRNAIEGEVELNRFTYVILGSERHYIMHAFLTPENEAEELPKFEELVSSLRE